LTTKDTKDTKESKEKDAQIRGLAGRLIAAGIGSRTASARPNPSSMRVGATPRRDGPKKYRVLSLLMLLLLPSFVSFVSFVVNLLWLALVRHPR
jgi:hypothetical protein